MLVAALACHAIRGETRCCEQESLSDALLMRRRDHRQGLGGRGYVEVPVVPCADRSALPIRSEMAAA